MNLKRPHTEIHTAFKKKTNKTDRAVSAKTPEASYNVLLVNKVVNEKKCNDALSGEIYATEKAYKLVEKGVPFRSAYKIIAKELSKK